METDIEGYCVYVMSSNVAHSEHTRINVTEFSYRILNQSVCITYNFTVRAVNIVGNGMPTSVIYHEVESSKFYMSSYSIIIIIPCCSTHNISDYGIIINVDFGNGIQLASYNVHGSHVIVIIMTV